MKAFVTAMGGRVRFEAEADSPKALWKKLSLVQGIFDAASACGVCGKTDIRYNHRVAKGFDFYELVCSDPQCNARLSFGQNKEGGGLFAKRKDESGNHLDYDGWSIYRPEHSSEPVPAPRPAAHVENDDVPF